MPSHEINDLVRFHARKPFASDWCATTGRVAPTWCAADEELPMRCRRGDSAPGRKVQVDFRRGRFSDSRRRSGGRFRRRCFRLEGHPGAVFTRIDRHDIAERNRDITRHAAEARLEADVVVVDLQPIGRVSADVEDDLPVADELHRHARPRVDGNGKIRRESVVAAPFVNGANEIGFGRRQGHGFAGR